MATLSNLIVKITGETGGLTSALQTAEKKTGRFTSGFGKHAKTAAKGAAIMGSAGIAAGGALVAGASKVASYGDEVATQADKVGVGTTALQEMNFWASENSINNETLEKSVGRLNQRIGDAADGTGKYAQAFEDVGVKVKDSQGNIRDTEDVMKDTIGALRDIESPAERGAKAMEIFGTKTARDLMPALADGSLSLEDAAKKADELGLVMGEDAIESSQKFQGSLDNLKNRATGMMRKALIPVMTFMANKLFPFIEGKAIPALEDLAEWIGPKLAKAGRIVKQDVLPPIQRFGEFVEDKVLPAIREFAGMAQREFRKLQGYMDSDLRPAFDNIKAAVEGIIDFITENWGTIMTVVRPILDTIIGYAQLLKTVYTNAIGIIVDIIGGDFSGAWEKAKTILRAFLTFLTDTLSNLGELIKAAAPLVLAGAKLLGKAIWNGIQAIMTELVIPGIKALPGKMKEWLISGAALLLEGGKSLLQALWDGAQALWTETILPGIKALPGKMKTGLVNAASALLEAGKTLLTKTWDGLQSVWNNTILPFLKDVPGLAKDGIVATVSKLTEAGKDLFNALWDAIDGIWTNDIVPFAKELPGNMKDMLVEGVSLLGEAGTNLMTSAWDALKAVWTDTISPFLTNLPGNAKGLLVAGVGRLTEAGDSLMSSAWDAINGLWNDTVSPFFSNLPGNAKDLIVGGAQKLFEAGSEIGGKLQDGIVSGVKGMASRVSEIASDIRGALKSAINSALRWLHNNVSISVPGIDPPGPGSIPGFDWNFPLIQLAKGGPIAAGQPAIVGESGPELFVPQKTGQVLSNDTLQQNMVGPGGSGVGVTVNLNGPITINAQDRRQAERAAGTFAWGTVSALRARGVA